VSHTTPTFCSLSLSRLQRVKPFRCSEGGNFSDTSAVREI
jgi:hypothetical protein